MRPVAPDPSPDEARSQFRRELVDPRYHTTDPVQRVLDWLDRTLGRSLDAASTVPLLGKVVAMVVLVLLAIALILLISRARRTRTGERSPGPVLADELVTAAELRRRAEQALAEGRDADAVVDGFRTLTVRQVERGVLPDVPQATAREVARALEAGHPAYVQQIEEAALLFDSVLYGERPAARDQAVAVLRLDDRLAGVRR